VKRILITGASSGIGHALATKLSKTGQWQVFAGVRDLTHTEWTSRENVTPVKLDVTHPDDLESTTEMIGSELHVLVNNAGENLLGPFEHTSERAARQLFETNFWGSANLSHRLLPALRQASGPAFRSKLIATGSIGSIAAVPWEPYYHATKFALLGLYESVRYELAAEGVDVCVVCPGGVATNFMPKTRASALAALGALPSDASPRYAAGVRRLESLIDQAGSSGSQPEFVAQRMVKIIEANSPGLVQFIGRDARLIALLRKVLPMHTFEGIYRGIFVPKLNQRT